jgi:hypothetical protein
MDERESTQPENSAPPVMPNVAESAEQKTTEPLEESATVSITIQSLLKSPDSLAARIGEGGAGRLTRNLLIICIACCLGYGLVMGCFSGGAQWYASPMKALMGLVLTSLLCLPSLYIFACIGGIDVKLGQIALVLVAANTLTTILLIGLAPVAWVFSQSTNSVFFMGFFHLAFWGIGFGFGMRFLLRLTEHFKTKHTAYLNIWIVIFLITSIQMMTVLRPLVGTSEHLFPKEKKFFIEHWTNTAGVEMEKQDAPSERK